MSRHFVLSAALAALLAFACSARADIGFNDFGSVSGLSLNGDAIRSGNVLRVVDPPVVPAGYQQQSQGSAWFLEKQTLSAGFDTEFTFNMNLVTDRGGDGFAFVIQNAPDGLAALGTGGSGLGYRQIPYSLAVEFDTVRIGESAADDHVSVQSLGAAGNTHQDEATLAPGAVVLPFELDDAQNHVARILYAPGSMEVFIDNLFVPRLTVPVDLTDVHGNSILDADGKAWVGFTAGTGLYQQNHDIHSWQMTTVPEPSTCLLALLGFAGAGILARRRSSGGGSPQRAPRT